MKRFSYFITTVLFTLLLSMQALASSAAITFSDPSVTVGSDVNVTMKVSSGETTLARADVTLAYDANLLEFVSGTDASGGAGTVRVNGGTNGSGTGTLEYNLKFHTLSAGTATLTIQNYNIYDADESFAELEHQGSSTVTISSAAAASTNTQLSSLVVSPGTLSPAFSADTSSYSLIVGTEVDTLAINAIAADSTASVQVSGNEQLSMGENTVTITVTAADGASQAVYTLDVTKQEGGPNVGDTTTTTATTNEGVKLSAKDKTITIMNPGSDVEIPEGFAESTIDIDGHQVKGWVWKLDTDHQYCIVYGMNEAGELNFYRYDLTEKTIQRYFEDPVEQQLKADAEQYPELVSRYDALVRQYNHMFILTCILAVAVLGLLVFVIVLVTRRHDGQGSSTVRRMNASEKNRVKPASIEDEGMDAVGAETTSLEETIPLHKLGELPKRSTDLPDDRDTEESELDATRVLKPEDRAAISGSDASERTHGLDIEDLDDVDEPTIALHDLGGVQHAPTEPEEEKEDLEHTRAFQMPKDSGLDIEDL